MTTTFEKVAYGGWANCYRLANNSVELIITADVGPRIIRFAFLNGDNLMGEIPATLGVIGGEEWNLFGGHRLWHAPEGKPRSYVPDNGPVSVTQIGDSIHVDQPTETTTGIQKALTLYMLPDAPQVKVIHHLTNQNLWTVELAPWALSVMNTGGTAIVPVPPRGSHETHLLPTHSLTLWAYTNMADPRWTWGEKYILLRQDVNAAKPQKVGGLITDGWAAYARNGDLFVKTFDYVPGATYPDLGCTVETFTNNEMLELETVAPLVRLEPGASVAYVENWHLFTDVAVPANDADVDAEVLPKAQTARANHRA